MIDANVTATLRYFESTEDAMEQACRETAARNAHTMDEADRCEDGSVGCPDCPFKGGAQ